MGNLKFFHGQDQLGIGGGTEEMGRDFLGLGSVRKPETLGLLKYCDKNMLEIG